MTTFLLIRHATCDHVGRVIAGRSLDVHLNEAGSAQAARLAELLDPVVLDAIASSPLPRALETATPVATRRNMAVHVLESLAEIGYGEWTGRSLKSLESDARWRRWNALRSVERIPGGELMLEVQARAVTALELLREQYPHGNCAVVTHGDVIRALVSHCAGIPLDLFQRIEIAPASVSVVVIDEDWIGVHRLNLTPEAWNTLA